MEEIKFLLLTIATEAPVALLLLWRREPLLKVLLASVCVNMITHPLAWFAAVHGANWYVVEFLVALTEATIFSWLFPKSISRAMFAAVAMNVISAVIGLLII